jgi:competence protein ComEC
VTVVDPWALLQPGFWLSFVAVGLLIASDPVRAPGPDPAAGWRARAGAALRAGLRTQAVATVGLAPLTLVFFQQLSLVGFVANLVAIPLVTWSSRRWRWPVCCCRACGRWQRP